MYSGQTEQFKCTDRTSFPKLCKLHKSFKYFVFFCDSSTQVTPKKLFLWRNIRSVGKRKRRDFLRIGRLFLSNKIDRISATFLLIKWIRHGVQTFSWCLRLTTDLGSSFVWSKRKIYNGTPRGPNEESRFLYNCVNVWFKVVRLVQFYHVFFIKRWNIFRSDKCTNSPVSDTIDTHQDFKVIVLVLMFYLVVRYLIKYIKESVLPLVLQWHVLEYLPVQSFPLIKII